MEIKNQIILDTGKCLELFDTKHFGAGPAHVGRKSMHNVQNNNVQHASDRNRHINIKEV
jgi:hypothetical protein